MDKIILRAEDSLNRQEEEGKKIGRYRLFWKVK